MLRFEQRRSLHRALAASVLGYGCNAGDVVAEHWPSDIGAKLIARGAVDPLDRDHFPALTAITVLPVVAPRSAASRRLDFAGISTISVPSIPSTMLPTFIAEGQPVSAAQASFAAQSIGPVRKLALIAGVSNELQNSAPENATAIIGRLMEQGASRGLDAAVFDAGAGDDTRPAGLLHGVTPIAAGTDMMADLRALVGAISDAKVIAEIVFIMRPERALALDTLARFSHPVLTSPQIGADVVIAVGVDGVASGYDGVPTIDSSKAAEINFAEPAAALVDVGGVASPSLSPFQQDLMLLKLRLKCAWGVVQVGAVQFVSGVTW